MLRRSLTLSSQFASLRYAVVLCQNLQFATDTSLATESLKMIVRRKPKIDTKKALLIGACIGFLSFCASCTPTPLSIPRANISTGQNGRCVNLYRTFAKTGEMMSPRAFHTATLLQDGTVLILGGVSGHWPLDSSEIFDPNTSTFSLSGTSGDQKVHPCRPAKFEGLWWASRKVAGWNGSPALRTHE